MGAYTSYSLFNARPADSGASITRGQAATGTNVVYSDRFAGGAHGFSLTIYAVGSMDGAFTLWKSDKMHPDPASDTDWVNVSSHDDWAPSDPGGSDASFNINSSSLRARFFRVKYVNVSGTGVISGDVTPTS